MQHTSLAAMPCPIARGLDRVGEWWSILILGDALYGITRFDQFKRSLGVARNILPWRLSGLVRAGLLARRRYCDRPPRNDYVPTERGLTERGLTERGRDFRPVLPALLGWANRHFAPEGESVVLADATTGRRAEPVMIGAHSGRRLPDNGFRLAAEPAAGATLRRRCAAKPATTLATTNDRRPS